MKIAFVHNYYQQKGGEDTVFANETAALRAAGFEVTTYTTHNNRISSARKPFLVFSAAFSVMSFFQIIRFILKNKPNIVHVHNFFPLISPSVFYACKLLNVPTVLTLHNYRIICPSATFYIEGRVNTKSINKGPWWTLRKKIYRNSYIGTFSVALMIWLNQKLGTWTRVDKFVTLTLFQKSIFQEFGFPATKIATIPNFIKEPSINTTTTNNLNLPDKFALYAGRITEEKGIETLIEASKSSLYPIVVVGSGSTKDISKVVDSANLLYIGTKQSSELQSIMKRASVLILPSLWYEGLPMVLVEAYSVGLPVIATDIGSLTELVRHGKTGFLFKLKNSIELSDCINKLCSDVAIRSLFSRNAKAYYDDNFTESIHISRLAVLYEEISNDK